ncbi:hypothetical protein GCM10010421_10470 [Streptomyces glaucus]|uniref:Uncharacterized protein n=1 Tax=Streptomyces glaucus TaxID=284029 RepID=A0ABP5WEM2_9ACTN
MLLDANGVRHDDTDARRGVPGAAGSRGRGRSLVPPALTALVEDVEQVTPDISHEGASNDGPALIENGEAHVFAAQRP